MKKAQDEILGNNSMYEGGKWTTIGIAHLHDVCREAIEKWQTSSPPLARRLQNLKSATLLEKKGGKEMALGRARSSVHKKSGIIREWRI
jgi:hypothetical protein